MESRKDYTNRLILAAPMLNDPNFFHSVVWILEHSENGSAGFVVNRLLDNRMGEIIQDFPMPEFPVYLGGPVENNTLHFVHRYGERITGGHTVPGGFTWGGEFDSVQHLADDWVLNVRDIRFFVGYSGWAPGQLEQEFEENAWVLGPEFHPEILEMEARSMWRSILRSMGGTYAIMANNPENPSLN